MARQKFIHDLAWALSELRVSSRSKGPLDDLRMIGLSGTQATLRLQPELMKNYDPSDFLDLPKGDQAKLHKAVEDFRRLTATAPGVKSPTTKQLKARFKSLEGVCDIVRKPILQEWSTAVESLSSDAEGWSKKRNWITKREMKEIEESLLKTYEVPQLLFYADGVTLLLDPIARFAMGAEGVAELAVVPSYDHLVLPRIADDGWRILSDESTRTKSDRLKPWNENSFVQAVSRLKTLK
jgi:hypothetical protein